MAIRLTETRLRQIIKETMQDMGIPTMGQERADAADWRREKGLDRMGRVKQPSAAGTAPVIKALEGLFGTEGLYNAVLNALDEAEQDGMGGQWFMQYPEAKAILLSLRASGFWIRLSGTLERKIDSGKIVPPSSAFLANYPDLAADYAESGY
jgi:hypothetical protein